MKNRIFLAACMLAAFFIFTACGEDPEARFARVMEQAASGDDKAAEEATGLILEKISPFCSSEAKIICDGRVIWMEEAGTVDILYPEKVSFKLPDPGLNSMRAVCSESAAFSDGQDICIFDGKGTLKRRFTAGSEKHPVMALAVKGNRVFFFREHSLYSVSGDDDPALLVQYSFSAPYSDFFYASIHMAGSRLGLILGVAGFYYFYLVDTEEKKILNTKVQMSSPEIYMGYDRVMHINGDTGKWAFSEFSCSEGKRKKFDVYSDLTSVYLFSDRIITERGSRFYTGDKSGREQKIPECLEITGACRNLVLIRYRGRIYGAKADLLSESVEKYASVLNRIGTGN